MTRWGATKAEENFSAVLDRAEIEGPQLIERRNQRFLLLTEEQFQNREGAHENPAAPTSDESNDTPKPFVSAWDLLRPQDDCLVDIEFPRSPGKVRAAEF